MKAIRYHEYPSAGASPRTLARTAGALYLVNILAGAFAIGLVPAMLAAPDVAATARNIQDHELLYRLGLAAHILVTVTNVPMAVIFYDLFKVVNRRLALLDAALILVATSIEAAGLLSQYLPLVLLGSAHYSSIPPAQLHALAYLPGDLATADYRIYTVFYGFDIACVAYLVLRSTFLPSAVAALLAVDALAYLFGGFAGLLAPGFAAHLTPWINLPAPLGEGTFCLWLLLAGVNATQWRKQARAATQALDPGAAMGGL